jgi:acetylglutamate kinase
MKKNLQIVKIGGNVIDDEKMLEQFLVDYSKIKKNKILVHGGGKLATELANKLGVAQSMIDGRRVTDVETLQITTMVYGGLINKSIVAKLQAKKTNAVGLCGADLNTINAHKRNDSKIDYGFVGDIDAVNTKAICALIESGAAIVFCAITHDGKGQLLNTNADTIASEIAIALSKIYNVQLNYCFEKNGVLKNIEIENDIHHTITSDNYKILIADGTISKGMIPKLNNAFNAIEHGVKKVIIGHSTKIAAIIKSEKNCGTILAN